MWRLSIDEQAESQNENSAAFASGFYREHAFEATGVASFRIAAVGLDFVRRFGRIAPDPGGLIPARLLIDL